MFGKKIFSELKGNNPAWFLYCLGAIAAALLVYTIIRSITVELTMDECYSWNVYTYGPHLYPIAYDTTAANDHWLNSWLMQFTGYLFGPHTWSLRLPNIFAHAVYLFFTARFVLKFRSAAFAISAFVLLNAHPYMLDFFSAARGYGLLFAGLSASFFYLIRYSSSAQSQKDLKYFLIASTLALLANFAMLDLYLLLMCVLLIFIFTGNRTKRMEQIRLVLCVCVPVLLIVVPHLLRMQKAGALYYGTDSLWEGTAKSLFTSLLYDAPYAGKSPFSSAKNMFYVLSALLIIGVLVSIKRKGLKSALRTSSVIFTLLLVGTLIALVIQNHVMHSLYPMLRMGIYLFILFLFAILTTLHELLHGRALTITTILLAIPVLFHFCCSANTSYLLDWKNEAGTQTVVDEIASRYNKLSQKKKIRIITNAINGPTLQFIQQSDQLKWLDVTINWSNDQPKVYDFYLVEQWTLDSYNTTSWMPIDTLPYSGNILFMDSSFAAGK